MCSLLVILFLSRLLSYSSKILNATQPMSSARVELLAPAQTGPMSVRDSPKHKVNSPAYYGFDAPLTFGNTTGSYLDSPFQSPNVHYQVLAPLDAIFGIWISDLPCHPNFKTEFDQGLGFFHPTTKGMSDTTKFEFLGF